LEHIIYSYSDFCGLILPPKTKIYQYVSDEKYVLSNYLDKIKDKMFLELLSNCMKQNTHEIMYKNITEIKKYLMNLFGEFNIDGWKIRSEINV
jgi:hypothetical protein